MRRIERIYIHTTASAFGDFEQVNQWHKERKFEAKDENGKIYNIGYHWLILNPYKTKADLDKPVNSFTDGRIVPGRPEELIGAHVSGDNANSIGIAYVGFTPTPAQYWSLLSKCNELLLRYYLTVDQIYGHHEYYMYHNWPIGKTCPNFDVNAFRGALRLLI